MKTPVLIAAMAACAPCAPISSAQDNAVPDKPAMDMGPQMSEMQQNMTATQAQMQAMQDDMTAMSGMGGGDMMQRCQMMKIRMSMMQMMMEQTLQHQQAMAPMTAKQAPLMSLRLLA